MLDWVREIQRSGGQLKGSVAIESPTGFKLAWMIS